MSRKPITRPAGSTAAPVNHIPNDLCPVCKRVRYLNNDMEFLINPECYHPMCSNCVTNIFKSGPAQCPYASCTKTLRQRGFKSAFFADLGIERETDIRRRVAAIFNKDEDDFENLRDYNDYLQQVEDLNFKLVWGGTEERHAAEAELLAWEQQHRAEIEKNKKRGRDAEAQRRRREAEQAEAAKRRRAEERAEEERMRAEEATIRDEVMEALSRGEPGSAAEIQERILAAKRAKLAQIGGSHFASSLFANGGGGGDAKTATNNASGGGMLSIRGLKDKKNGKKRGSELSAEDRGPYDPFAGLRLEPTRYELQPEGYNNTWLDDARNREDHRVPGYNVHEYMARAMFEAFAGLGVVVGDEKAGQESDRATANAAAAARSGTTTAIAAGGGGSPS